MEDNKKIIVEENKKEDKPKTNIKLDDKMFQDVNIDLLNDKDDYDDDEILKVKDFYDFDKSIFDFGGPVGSIGKEDKEDFDMIRPSRRMKVDDVKSETDSLFANNKFKSSNVSTTTKETKDKTTTKKETPVKSKDIKNDDSSTNVKVSPKQAKTAKMKQELESDLIDEVNQKHDVDINLFDNDKQKIYNMFNQDQNVMFDQDSSSLEEQVDNQVEAELNDESNVQTDVSNQEEEVIIKDNQNQNVEEEYNYDEVQIKSLIESALYVYGAEGLSVANLKKLTNAPSQLIKKIMKQWMNELDNDASRGLTIKIFGDRYKFFTKTENRENLSKLITIKYRDPLTPRVIETLAIIAYNQPCTKAIIEDIRGKDPTSAIQKLMDLGLIVEVGRANNPGRPLLFEVTPKFYDIFGIKNVKDLPVINLDQPFQDDDISFFDTTRFNE